MKITYYLYNAFIIESESARIAIDPGGLFLYHFRFTSLIPKSEWNNLTHIFVTHADPDHYWHTDRLAQASDAHVICNTTMAREVNGQKLLPGPRNKGLAFTTCIKNLHTLAVNETISLDNISITGIKTTHGSLTFKFGPISGTVSPGPDKRIGWGAIGYKIDIDGKIIVNLGDTLLHKKEWEDIINPDVLMIPIGGRFLKNTMDENDAIEAVRIMQPELVIPCHYNCPAFFSKKYAPADDKMFREEIEKMNIRCAILEKGEAITL